VSETKQDYIDIGLSFDLKEEFMRDSNESLSVVDLLYNHFLPEKLHADGNNQYF